MARGTALRTGLVSGVALLVLLAGCDRRGTSAVNRPGNGVLVEADIGAEGGFLAIGTGEHSGVGIAVPAGAVAAPTRFRIRLVKDHDAVPALFPVYSFEPAALDLGGNTVVMSLRFAAALLDGSGAPPPVAGFVRPGPGEPWLLLQPAAIDPDGRSLTVSSPRLGEFTVLDGSLYRLLLQEQKLLDPSQQTAIAAVAGVPITVPNGGVSLAVGRGSLASFWGSPAARNLLVLHGLFGGPVDFLDDTGLVASAPAEVHNIVLCSFPSGLGVAAAANALYDLIERDRQPGFGCSIVAHSMGGLVARYLLERSAEDPGRPGYQVGAAPLGAAIAQLVMLGVPHAGVQFADDVAATFLPALPPSQRRFWQAFDDLRTGPGTVTAALNSAYVDHPTRYHVIYGDLGWGSDGVVTVASALAVPLTPPETARMFIASHDDLYRSALPLGIAAHVADLLLQP